MLVALSGTPGTGKTTVSRLLEARGYRVCRLGDLARERGLQGPYDDRRESYEVDPQAIGSVLPPERPLVAVGHWAHLLPVDRTVVLRCHPEALRLRLDARGWPPSKVQENLEAEAMGVIVGEALERGESYEVDTTRRAPEEVTAAAVRILEGAGGPFRAGRIDFSEAILAWF